MAQAPNFSDAQILQACQDIRAQGKNLNATALRTHLGGGTVPYFQKTLDRLRLGGLVPEEAQGDSDVAVLMSQLKPVIDQMRKIANREADASLVRAKADHEAALTAANDKTLQLSADLRIEQERRRDRDLQLHRLEIDLAQLKSQHHELVEKHAKLAASSQEMEKTINRQLLDNQQLEHQRTHLQDELSRTHETYAQERLSARSHYETVVGELREDIKRRDTAAIERQHEKVELAKQAARLSEQVTQLNRQVVQWEDAAHPFIQTHGSLAHAWVRLQKLEMQIASPLKLVPLTWAASQSGQLTARLALGELHIELDPSNGDGPTLRFISPEAEYSLNPITNKSDREELTRRAEETLVKLLSSVIDNE